MEEEGRNEEFLEDYDVEEAEKEQEEATN